MLAALALYAVGGARAAELAHNEFTSAVTVSGTAANAPTTVVTASEITVDGSTKVCVEASAPSWENGSNSSSNIRLHLWDGSTDLGELARFRPGSTAIASLATPLYAKRCFTPSNGAHTFSARAWRELSNGTVNAGSGGAGALLPGYIRITTEGGGGGATALDDLTDVDLTGYGDGDVLKYSSADTAWVAGTDLLGEGGGGGGGEVTLSAGDRERLDLAWWGVWALVGLALLALIAPAMYRLLDVRHGMGGRFERG